MLKLVYAAAPEQKRHSPLPSVVVSFRSGGVHAAGSLQASQPVTAGRVVVTITTLEGAVHVPGVEVELRAPDEDLVIARSLTDGAGQVTFPDVPPGRYIITASRAGFVTRDSTVFTVTADETAQVLLDTQLTFVPPEVEVRADDMPSADRQRSTGVDERHAVGIDPRKRSARGRRLSKPPAAASGSRAGRQWTPEHPGRSADAGCAADQQRQPHRPLVRRLRPRPAGAERPVGGSPGEPVCCRIWPLHHERDGDSDETRDE